MIEQCKTCAERTRRILNLPCCNAMKTRFHASILALSMLATVGLVDAQTTSNIPKLGFLASSNASVFATRLKALLLALQGLGYIEGRTVVIEYRWADGKTDRLPAFAAELLDRNVNIIITPGTTASVAAKKATNTIPIVFVNVGSPDKVG